VTTGEILRIAALSELKTKHSIAEIRWMAVIGEDGITSLQMGVFPQKLVIENPL